MKYLQHLLKMQRLDEARKNKHHHAQKRQFDMDVFNKYRELPQEELSNYFVTFTSEDKVGINPSSSNQRNPIGIYTYSLLNILKQSRASDVPFAGEQPYIFIVKAKKPILNLHEYSHSNLIADMKKLLDYAKNNLKGENIDQKTTTNIISSMERLLNGNNSAYNNNNNGSPAGAFLFDTVKSIAKLIDNKNFLMRINSIFVKVLNYQILNDPYGDVLGRGGVAQSQCVFLNRQALDVVEKLKNPDIDKHGSIKMSNKLQTFSKRADVKQIEFYDDYNHIEITTYYTKPEVTITDNEVLITSDTMNQFDTPVEHGTKIFEKEIKISYKLSADYKYSSLDVEYSPNYGFPSKLINIIKNDISNQERNNVLQFIEKQRATNMHDSYIKNALKSFELAKNYEHNTDEEY